MGRNDSPRRYRRRQLALAALAANALRPPAGGRSGIAGFSVGWPVSELAPHLLVASAVDTALELTVRRRRSGTTSRIGLLAAGTSMGLLGYSIAAARRARIDLDEALTTGLGADSAAPWPGRSSCANATWR